MANKEEIWKEELLKLHSILSKAPLEVKIKWGAPVFTYNNKNVVSYGGFKNYFALWFFNGVFLKDPKEVLLNAQEGKTKSLRQWRFEKIDDLNEQQILDYVLEAIEVEKKRIKSRISSKGIGSSVCFFSRSLGKRSIFTGGIFVTDTRKAQRVCDVFNRSETNGYKATSFR